MSALVNGAYAYGGIIAFVVIWYVTCLYYSRIFCVSCCTVEPPCLVLRVLFACRHSASIKPSGSVSTCLLLRPQLMLNFADCHARLTVSARTAPCTSLETAVHFRVMLNLDFWRPVLLCAHAQGDALYSLALVSIVETRLFEV
ncbi:hypothetical protein OH77DRAFT_24076 [Trametes cingulata]|nr:hypothetical protein OH77DRAFT_24076 [Trametes cingulata]